MCIQSESLDTKIEEYKSSLKIHKKVSNALENELENILIVKKEMDEHLIISKQTIDTQNKARKTMNCKLSVITFNTKKKTHELLSLVKEENEYLNNIRMKEIQLRMIESELKTFDSLLISKSAKIEQYEREIKDHANSMKTMDEKIENICEDIRKIKCQSDVNANSLELQQKLKKGSEFAKLYELKKTKELKIMQNVNKNIKQKVDKNEIENDIENKQIICQKFNILELEKLHFKELKKYSNLHKNEYRELCQKSQNIQQNIIFVQRKIENIELNEKQKYMMNITSTKNMKTELKQFQELMDDEIQNRNNLKTRLEMLKCKLLQIECLMIEKEHTLSVQRNLNSMQMKKLKTENMQELNILEEELKSYSNNKNTKCISDKISAVNELKDKITSLKEMIVNADGEEKAVGNENQQLSKEWKIMNENEKVLSAKCNELSKYELQLENKLKSLNLCILNIKENNI